jgi:fibronectin-binding autotransporter adhesin
VGSSGRLAQNSIYATQVEENMITNLTRSALLARTGIAVFAVALASQARAQDADSPCGTSPAGTCTIDNSEDIDGDVEIFLEGPSQNNVTISNSGTITGGIDIDADESDSETSDSARFSFTNSGTLSNNHASAFVDSAGRRYIDSESLGIEAQHKDFNVTNRGTISETMRPGFYIPYGDRAMVSLSNEANFDSVSTVTNSGTITTNIYGTTGLVIGALSESDEGVPANVNPIVNVTNSGTISSTGGAILRVDPRFLPTGQLVGSQNIIEAVAGLAVGARGSGNNAQVTVTNSSTGRIESGGTLRLGQVFTTVGGQPISVPPPQGQVVINGVPAGFGTVALATSSNVVTITNDGTIAGGVGSFIPVGNTTQFNAGSGIDLGDGDADWALTFPDRYLAGAIHTFGGSTDLIKNSATGTVTGSIDLGAGNDRIENSGIINGAVFLRGGDDEFRQLVTATYTGTADGGIGDDRLVFDLTGGSFDAAILSRFVNFEQTVFTGKAVFSGETVLPLETFVVENGSFDLQAGASFQTQGPVAITGGAGTEAVTIAGTVNGNVDLGGGNDSLTLSEGGAINGVLALGGGDDVLNLSSNYVIPTAIDGGEGTDRIAFSSNGLAETPNAIDALGSSAFEELEARAGYNIVNNAVATNRLQILGGQLFGQSGSTITAPNITVAQGATFGSAGRVTGNVAVNGTLAPGASPGTMTVVGNVSLASGSNTLFELSETVNDQLLISGTLSIASGASLTLTGTRALTPGSTLDLIVADGGITGSFGTIAKPVTIGGFIAQRGNRIQLLGQFATAPSFAPLVSDTVDYVNAVLVSGQASASLLNDLPVLLTGTGGTNEAAFVQLSPEAYASATQIGLENGLAVSKALRSVNRQQTKAGPFTFAQGFGNWRRFGANAKTGTSRSSTNSAGVLGGIGIGGENGAIAAFVGYSDSQQSIGAIGTKTEADGMLFGLTGGFTAGGFGASASLSFDNNKADTARTLPGNAATGDRYSLKSLSLDASLGYAIAMGDNWAVMPEIGVTHISTKRGAVSETGSAAFDLAVLHRTAKATFVDAGLTLTGGRKAEAKAVPWLSLGLRHHAGGDAIAAVGGFKSAAATYVIPGAERRDTLLTLGAGIEAKVSKGLSLNASYRGEYGKGNAGSNVSAGLKLAF